MGRWASAGLQTGLICVLLMALPACVKIQAPDKPIEINVNVRVQVEKDAEELLKSKPGLF